MKKSQLKRMIREQVKTVLKERMTSSMDFDTIKQGVDELIGFRKNLKRMNLTDDQLADLEVYLEDQLYGTYDDINVEWVIDQALWDTETNKKRLAAELDSIAMDMEMRHGTEARMVVNCIEDLDMQLRLFKKRHLK